MAHIWPALVGVLLGGRGSSFGSSSSDSTGSGTVAGRLADMLGLDDHVFWMGVSTLYWLVGIAAFLALGKSSSFLQCCIMQEESTSNKSFHRRRLDDAACMSVASA